jgi:hypothetical protein
MDERETPQLTEAQINELSRRRLEEADKKFLKVGHSGDRLRGENSRFIDPPPTIEEVKASMLAQAETVLPFVADLEGSSRPTHATMNQINEMCDPHGGNAKSH